MIATCRGHSRTGPKVALLGVAAIWLVACAAREAPPPAAAPRPVAHVDSPPEWRPGDRWVYDWTSGTRSGTKTAEVLEITEVNKIRYYVLRIGEVDHYYTPAFRWSGSVRESRVEARMVPPQPWLTWPLAVGSRWVHNGVYEERDTKKEQNDRFAVVAAETVEVPAGRFHAFKVVREGNRQESDQYWYAPEVRWYVRWVGRRGETQFEERLREYHAAPRLIPESAPESQPSKTK